MRSRSIATLMAVLMLSSFVCGKAFAMPSDGDSNTWQTTKLFPDAQIPGLDWAIGLGATGDYVIDRTLDNAGDIDESAWYGGNVYVDPLENVHLNLFFGAADFNIGGWPINEDTTTKVTLKTEADFAFGVSAKGDVTHFAVFPNMPDMNLFVSGGYRFCRAGVNDVDGGVWNALQQSLDVEVDEWMATLGVSQRWDNPLSFIGWNGFSIVPYVGVQYSDLNVNVSGNSVLPNNNLRNATQSVATTVASSDNAVAIATGMQILSFNDVLAVAVEGRFIAETSVSISGHVRW